MSFEGLSELIKSDMSITKSIFFFIEDQQVDLSKSISSEFSGQNNTLVIKQKEETNETISFTITCRVDETSASKTILSDTPNQLIDNSISFSQSTKKNDDSKFSFVKDDKEIDIDLLPKNVNEKNNLVNEDIMNSYEEEKKNHMQQISDLKESLSLLNTENTSLKNRNEELITELSQLKSEKNTIEMENEWNTSRIKELEQQVKSLTQRNTISKEAIQNIKKQKEQSNDVIVSLRKKMTELSMQYQALSTANVSLEEQFLKMDSQIYMKKQKDTEALNKFYNMPVPYEDENSVILQLKNERDSYSKELIMLKDKYDAITNENKNLNHEKSIMMNKVQLLNNDSKYYNDTIKDYCDQIQSMDEENKLYIKEIEQLKEDYELLKASKVAIEEKYNSLSNDMIETEKVNLEEMNVLEEYKQDNQQLLQIGNSLKEKINMIQLQKLESDRELNECRQLYEQLLYTCQLWKYRYANVYDDYDKCKDQIKDYCTQIDLLQHQIKDIEDEQINNKKNNEELLSQITLLTEENNLCEEELDYVKEENKTYKDQLQIVVEEADRYKKNYYIVVQALKRYESPITENDEQITINNSTEQEDQ
ncbi:hypothetical protein WA158_000009 [Blastocystis sp. Blastoise]